MNLAVHDNRFHLTGATRILNSSSSFCSLGGLGEAVAWLCLRQVIYISLVFQQPLKTNLENFRKSQSFRGNDDLSRANRMVHLLARVLSCAFLENSTSNNAILQQLNDEVENWGSTKPVSFDPIKFRPPAQEIQSRYPTIWMLSPFHGKSSCLAKRWNTLKVPRCSRRLPILQYCKTRSRCAPAKSFYAGLRQPQRSKKDGGKCIGWRQHSLIGVHRKSIRRQPI